RENDEVDNPVVALREDVCEHGEEEEADSLAEHAGDRIGRSMPEEAPYEGRRRLSDVRCGVGNCHARRGVGRATVSGSLWGGIRRTSSSTWDTRSDAACVPSLVAIPSRSSCLMSTLRPSLGYTLFVSRSDVWRDVRPRAGHPRIVA